MDVSIRLGHDFGAHPGAAALAGAGLVCPDAGALGQHRVYASGNHDLSSLCVLVSAYILILSYRQQDENTIKDGLTLDD